MRKFNENDIVVIVKKNDRHYGQKGRIYDISELNYAPVSIYYVSFDDGRKGYYFFSELSK